MDVKETCLLNVAHAVPDTSDHVKANRGNFGVIEQSEGAAQTVKEKERERERDRELSCTHSPL